MPAAGYDIGASLSGSSSSGASLSGATDQGGGGNYGGVSYGPGTLLIGAAVNPPTTPAAKTGIWIAVIIGIVVVLGAYFARGKS